MKKTISMLLMAAGLMASATETVFNKTGDCCLESGMAVNPTDGLYTLKGQIHLFSRKMFIPQPGKKYKLLADIQVPADKPVIYGFHVAVIYYKNENQRFFAREYHTVPGTLTELAKPLAATDTTITIKAPAQWQQEKEQKYVLVFHAKADESDLPNSICTTTIKDFKKVGDDLVITLAKPVYAAFPAGTKVRLHYDSNFYQECLTPEKNWPKKNWDTYGGEFKIPAGVKFFRPAIIYYSESPLQLRNFKLVVE